MTDTRDLTYQQ